MITDGIVALLKADATLSALTTRLAPVGAANGLKSPFVIYHIGTATPQYDSQGDSGYQCARFQFDCYSGTSYTEARTVAVALRNVLKNVKNTTLSDANSTFVQAMFADPPVDLTFVPQGGTQSIEYRVMVQVEVHFQGN